LNFDAANVKNIDETRGEVIRRFIWFRI